MPYSLTKCIFCQESVNEVMIYVLPTYWKIRRKVIPLKEGALSVHFSSWGNKKCVFYGKV